jgi:hypothetical protein
MRVPGIASIVLCTLVATAHAQWDAEVPLTSTSGDIYGEGLAASGTTVHVIYGNTDVRYRRSTDNGGTWQGERTLDTGVIHLTDPLVADGNDVWAIYLKNIANKMDWCCPRDAGDIYLLHSGDGGTTWDTPKRLTTGASAFRLSIAYSANRLHVVWMDYRDNEWDTYYLRSNDRGATWDAEKIIAQSMGTFGAERPQVAARGDGVHVTIWDDRGTNPPCMAGPTFSFTTCPDTFYIGSLDGGATWGTEVPVDYSGAAFAGRNDIAVPTRTRTCLRCARPTMARRGTTRSSSRTRRARRTTARSSVTVARCSSRGTTAAAARSQFTTRTRSTRV